MSFLLSARSRRSACGASGAGAKRSFQWSCAAFTLIELVAVIAIIAILSSIVFTVSRYALERGRASRTQGDLATLVSALEAYRTAHGDFPRTGSVSELLQSLIGRRSPTGGATAGRAFLEGGSFDFTADPFTDTAAIIRDAWGSAYRYAYRTEEPWSNPRYVLYSYGPDRSANDTLSSGGFADTAHAANRDNLIADNP